MRIVMMGTGPFAVPSFQTLVDSSHDVVALVTRPTPPTRGRRKSPLNPVRDLGESLGLPIFDPQSVNDAESLEWLAGWDADLLMVCDYGQILSREALGQARAGGINLHASLLPKYRGAAPINWAIWEGETETGVTVIHMTPKLDGGPCLVQRRMPITAADDAEILEPKLAVLGAQAVLDAVEMLVDWDGDTSPGEVQDEGTSSRAPRLRRSDGEVDWNQPAVRIFNQVRALKPWPGTFVLLPGKQEGQTLRVILHEVHALAEPPQTPPGSVCFVDRETVRVATGEGQLELRRVQPAGKRVMDVAEFLRGHPLEIGQQLTS